MITADMRMYDYYTYGDDDGYGQATLSAVPQGKIPIAIYVTNQQIQQNLAYKEATYVGLTYSDVDDTYVVQYGNKRLKVMYVQNKGRFTQAFMKEVV